MDYCPCAVVLSTKDLILRWGTLPEKCLDRLVGQQVIVLRCIEYWLNLSLNLHARMHSFILRSYCISFHFTSLHVVSFVRSFVHSFIFKNVCVCVCSECVSVSLCVWLCALDEAKHLFMYIICVRSWLIAFYLECNCKVHICTMCSILSNGIESNLYIYYSNSSSNNNNVKLGLISPAILINPLCPQKTM